MTDELKKERWFRVDKEYINMRVRLRAAFAERMELAQFPFDVQDLQILLTTTQPACEAILVRRTNSKGISAGVFATANFAHADVWEPGTQVRFYPALSDPADSASGTRYPLLSCYVQLRRRSAYFLWSITLPVFFIVLCSFTTWWLSDLADKLNVTFVMILTLVALKFVVANELPNVSYLTYMDRYLMLGIVTLFLLVAQNVVETELGEKSGGILLLILLLPWILVHVLLIYAVSKHRPSMDNMPISSHVSSKYFGRPRGFYEYYGVSPPNIGEGPRSTRGSTTRERRDMAKASKDQDGLLGEVEQWFWFAHQHRNDEGKLMVE
eukprot:m.30433 g.30433  ORF g.30433 m.30433 type:complete len:324 (+) comp14555_c0_seq1:216-1187(+)